MLSTALKAKYTNFYFSLSGVPNVRGGWVGSDVWDKVPKKRFFDTFPYAGNAIKTTVSVNRFSSYLWSN